MGCRGPVTYNACGVIRWNNGVSYPIQSGHGCIGCSEANFWDNGPFYQHLASFPGFGIETTADKVGAGRGGRHGRRASPRTPSRPTSASASVIKEEIETSDDAAEDTRQRR